MNKTAAALVKEFIESIPEGQPFPSNALRPFASTENIRQILSRLIKTGDVKRVARGIFVKPKHVHNIGAVMPSPLEIAEMLTSSTGEIIGIYGAEALRQLQLTTQVPMRPIFYTSGNTRSIQIANRTVNLKHVNPSRLIAPGTMAGVVVTALSYMGRGHVTTETISTIKTRISAQDFQETLHLIDRMPAWLSNLFYRYQRENFNDN